MEDGPMTIGEVAKQVGIRTSAIRYYEEQGVLPDPPRVSGQRRYGKEIVQKLEALQVAQEAGFSLPEIRDLLDESESEESSAKLRDLAKRKLPEIRALIARAQAMESWLETARNCDCSGLDVCDLFREPDLRPGAASDSKVSVARRSHRATVDAGA